MGSEMCIRDSSRCSSVAAPFYERALAGTLEKLGSVDAAMLERARSKLGVDDEDAAKMHSQCLNEEIDLLLKDGELTDSDAERLDQLASVLGISNEDASQAIAAKTVPIYVDATRKAVDNAIAADEAAQKALGADSAPSWNFNVTRSRRWRPRDAASRRWRLHDRMRVYASRGGVSRRRPCHTGQALQEPGTAHHEAAAERAAPERDSIAAPVL